MEESEVPKVAPEVPKDAPEAPVVPVNEEGDDVINTSGRSGVLMKDAINETADLDYSEDCNESVSSENIQNKQTSAYDADDEDSDKELLNEETHYSYLRSFFPNDQVFISFIMGLGGVFGILLASVFIYFVELFINSKQEE